MSLNQWVGEQQKTDDLARFVTEEWRVSEEDETQAFLRTAALLYWMYETRVEVDGYAERLFTTLSIGRDQLGLPQRESGTWTDFVSRHLGMTLTDATKTRRVWDVFVEQLDVSPDLLQIAGRSRLREAAPVVESVWKELDEFPHKIRVALFGEPNRCRHCKEYVYEPHPEDCPACDRPYEELKPKPIHVLQALLAEYRTGPEKEPPPYSASMYLEHEEGADCDFLRVQVTFSKNGESVPLTWTIAVVDDPEKAPEGMTVIPYDLVPDIKEWLGRLDAK